MNTIDAFMRERDVARSRSCLVQKILARAMKYVSRCYFFQLLDLIRQPSYRLNYMHFSQFGMVLEQMSLADFEYLSRWKVTTVPPCVSTLTNDSVGNESDSE